MQSTVTHRLPKIVYLLIPAAALALAGCLSAPTSHKADLASADREPTNTVTWSTASESDNFGFDVYRAETPEGPFVRITPQPMLGAGTSDLKHDYRFTDREVTASKTYFYYVESISLSGERKRFTPVMQAPPKQPPIKTPEDGGF
ncbi:MAG: hypothetical protein LC637_08480 [Xanthomonadaceae bacterium]|nr:hypothetical protein [Xanthomonadaceae bacterium]